ncbi:MAG TPA: cupredoxin family copper-binding protein [Acidimicrobiales bacterium]|nr:cupredoxin family copper-binding protein [Acidimicrobiales bacterium]
MITTPIRRSPLWLVAVVLVLAACGSSKPAAVGTTTTTSNGATTTVGSSASTTSSTESASGVTVPPSSTLPNSGGQSSGGPSATTTTASGGSGSGTTSTTKAPSATTTTSGQKTFAITIQNFAFSPSNLNVPVGATVTVTNKDSSTHTWTANDGTFDSGDLAQGKSFSFTFKKAGSYPYKCTLHTFMTGTVTVG